ncbi:uncharacterized protein LOC123705261 [Colias croceus]|uniref:uncharacterized protein LOC123705261 n=1 Tax=Colias crocea TaxID=72248 RepID=UPI001E27EE3C|nr:uncharacterized protein LOC123705261 [Colias croceus]
MPTKKHTQKFTLSWWNDELAQMKKEVATRRRRIRNAAPVRRDRVVGLYLEQKEKYEKAVKDAQCESWKEFCRKQDREGVWEGIYRVLNRATGRVEDLPLTRGGETLNARSSAELLAETFYPVDLASNRYAIEQKLGMAMTGENLPSALGDKCRDAFLQYCRNIVVVVNQRNSV